MKIKQKKLLSRNWVSTQVGNGNFEVEDGWKKYNVDLDTKTCSCRK